MKKKEYAVLCAQCAERMREFFELEKLPVEKPGAKRCKTCLRYGDYSKYKITARRREKV